MFNDPLWIDQLFGWAQSLPKPRAVLIVSAHWESAPLALSASAAGTPLVYDFGGFDRRFYSMTYPTPDAGALAAQVTALLSDTESVHEHPGARPGPRRLGAAQGDVPVRGRAGAAAQPADARTRTGCCRSGRGCVRCASRAS